MNPPATWTMDGRSPGQAWRGWTHRGAPVGTIADRMNRRGNIRSLPDPGSPRWKVPVRQRRIADLIRHRLGTLSMVPLLPAAACSRQTTQSCQQLRNQADHRVLPASAGPIRTSAAILRAVRGVGHQRAVVNTNQHIMYHRVQLLR